MFYYKYMCRMEIYCHKALMKNTSINNTLILHQRGSEAVWEVQKNYDYLIFETRWRICTSVIQVNIGLDSGYVLLPFTNMN